MFPHFIGPAETVMGTAGQWSPEFLALQLRLCPCAARIRENQEAEELGEAAEPGSALS